MVLQLCQQFSCTPSQLDQEDAEIIRLIGIVARGSRTPEGVSEE